MVCATYTTCSAVQECTWSPVFVALSVVKFSEFSTHFHSKPVVLIIVQFDNSDTTFKTDTFQITLSSEDISWGS